MKTPEQVLQAEIDQKRTPGAAYVFFNTDSVTYSFEGGLADIQGQVPLTRHTMFNAFSVTKTMTALAILILDEEGRLNLNDPVKKHLPFFQYGDGITIRHLLNHTGGLPNPIPLTWIHLPEEHDSFDREGYFAEIFDRHNTVRSAPGARYYYSNLGYIVLGQVIEQITGQPFEDFVTSRILQVAALPGELSFRINTDNHAKGYQKKNSLMNLMLGFFIDKRKYMNGAEGSWKPFRYNYLNGATYGGLIASLDGLARYGQAMLQQNGIASEAIRHQLFTETVTLDGKPTGMCLSWFAGFLEGNRYYSHSGGGGGYYVELRLYPDLRCGSAVIFNRSGMKDERFLDKLDISFMVRESR